MQAITDDEFHVEVREADVPTVVMFKASWCNPCSDFFPLVEDLANKMPNFRFVTMDLDEANSREGETSVIADELGIRTIPSLAIFNDGMVRDILVGRHLKNEVRHWINENY